MDDRYQTIQRTSELPFGTQFEAIDQLISRQAQIHRFANPGDDAPSDWKKLYDKGSGSLTTLSHMGLPIIYDRGVNAAGPYLIRQLVGEPTLTSRLEQGPLNEYEFWELAQQLLDIHSVGVAKGFFHGALRPDQICYATRPGGEKRYYITDFGLAELHNKINGTQEYYGQPCLVSMEQLNGEAPTEKSQVFSIGQLLYLCIVDNHPFSGNQLHEMAELHKNYPLAAVTNFRADIPQPMLDWLTKMTAVDANNRYSDYTEAFENLPASTLSAQIPVIPTVTTHQQPQVSPVDQTTTVQQTVTAQAGIATAGFTTTTQALTSPRVKAKSSGVIKSLLQEPLIIGAAVVIVVLIVVGVMVFSRDDDRKVTVIADKSAPITELSADEDEDDSSTAVDSDSGQNGLKSGLKIALNFDESLAAKNNKSIKVEPLKSGATFKKGLYGSGLVLDKEHFYRLPLKSNLPDGLTSSFTISFWVHNMEKQDPAFISDQPWRGNNSYKLVSKDSKEKDFWKWTPVNLAKQQASSRKDWSMVTLVFSRKSKKVTVYNNGEMIGSSSTDAIKSLDDEDYLYLGCDSRQKFNFTSPTIIDQLYIWDRQLKSKEIRSMFKGGFTL